MAPTVSSSGVSPWNTVTLRVLSSTLIQLGTVRRRHVGGPDEGPHPVGSGGHLHVEPLALVLHDPEHEGQVVLRRVRQRPAHRDPAGAEELHRGHGRVGDDEGGRARRPGRRRRRVSATSSPTTSTFGFAAAGRGSGARRLPRSPRPRPRGAAGAATSTSGRIDGRRRRARRRPRSPRRRSCRRKPWRTPAPPNSARPERTDGASTALLSISLRLGRRVLLRPRRAVRPSDALGEPLDSSLPPLGLAPAVSLSWRSCACRRHRIS